MTNNSAAPKTGSDTDRLKGEFSAQLKNAWQKKLLGHHRYVLEKYLPFIPDHMRTKLKPFLIFFENNRQWGYYNHHDNLIGLNLKLFELCPWSTVLEIFGHEIAHQLVSHLAPQKEAAEGPHGPTFQEFCRQLRVDPIFARPTVDEMTAKVPPNPYAPKTEMIEDPILAKVQKLLALSSSPEPAEAEAALAAAGRLMAKHNLELPQKSGDIGFENFEHWSLPLNSARISNKVSLIGQILLNHFFVEVIFTYTYNHLANRVERTIDIVGRRVNLVMAEHVFHFLMERTETLWEYHKPLAKMAGEKGIGAKSVFINSLLVNFLKKLDQSQQQAMVQEKLSSSLVIFKSDIKLQNYYDYLFPNRHSRTFSGSSAYAPFSQKAGAEAGRNLTINQPIGGSEGQGGVSGYLG
jgi:hypothetical protein